MKDQAEQLRRQLSRLQAMESLQPTQVPTDSARTKVITVCSGKGGVGKSNFSLNFALSLLQQQKKVLIIDVDLGLANIDVLLGISPKRNLLHMLEENLSIWDVIQDGPEGLKLVAGGSGFNHLFHADQAKFDKLLKELERLQGTVDYIILDTGAGLSYESLRFMLAADEAIIVTTPEPTSVTDAYAVLKMAYSEESDMQIKLVINRCTTPLEGRRTAERITMVAKQFLEQDVGVLGYIPDDPLVMQAVKKQHPFLLEYSNSPASEAFRDLTRAYLQLPSQQEGGLRGFIKKYLKPRFL